MENKRTPRSRYVCNIGFVLIVVGLGMVNDKVFSFAQFILCGMILGNNINGLSDLKKS